MLLVCNTIKIRLTSFVFVQGDSTESASSEEPIPRQGWLRPSGLPKVSAHVADGRPGYDLKDSLQKYVDHKTPTDMSR